MVLEKPENYREVPALQDGETIFAEDHNQIMANIEKLKGGKPNEAPVSNIKELKGILDKIITNNSFNASSIYFDNQNAQLKYIKYNFPKFKLDISEKYYIVFTDEKNSKEYQAVIEKQTDGTYRFKSKLSNYYCNNAFTGIIKYINGFHTAYSMYAILSQFFDVNILRSYDLDTDEAIISTVTKRGTFFNTSVNDNKLCFFILVKDGSIQTEEVFTENYYNVFFNIKNRVLNKIDRNIFFSNNLEAPFFRLELIRNDNKIKVIGAYQHINGISSLICYSPILENYFNIISNDNELINTDGITSSSGKPKKFGFMKYSDEPSTYCLKIANQDGSEIGENEIITFDLTPDKNAEVEVKEKVIETVQDAIEALSDTYSNDFDSEPAEPTPDNPEAPDNPEEEIYSFEKTTFTLEAEGESIILNSGIIKDISSLSLVKNTDGSFNLKGSFEINNEGQAVIRTNKQIDLDRRKLLGMYYGGMQVIYKYENKYLYIIIIADKIQSPILKIGDIKIYDNNIICPPDFSYIKVLGYEVSEDFGIYLVNGVYRLKGSFKSNSNNMSFFLNLSMKEFFEDKQQYSYSSYKIGIISGEPLYTMLSISSITPNQKYTIDMECP
ncbi:hypothetical protein, partial [Brachyspira sp. G79]|uniref:hypothetical protein n=1 Tax=Brachyspira sp. G79 TaxID=1358104 RepID=UPI00196B47BC